MTEVLLDLRGVNADAGFTTWVTKKAASADYRELRRRGLNVEKDLIRFHRAVTGVARCWVIARPDQLAEMTWLMRGDGRWARGRMIETYRSATWAPLPPPGGGLIPATFTHVTRTVHAAGRHERYRTKSNGSAGRWVMTDDSVALCTCGWKAHAGTRDEARWRARHHRDSPITD